jgi:trans-2,3-dihydro-3-hydroxyanthranilate isomerase
VQEVNRRELLGNSGGALAASSALGLFLVNARCQETDPHLRVQPLFRTGEGAMQIPFSFVDVFAEKPLTGNPLAIIPHAEALEDETMQRIAGELNQAETTFILPARTKSADWHLRSFTASGHEIFGAGHNSLGAWWWLAESGELKLSDGSNHFTQEIGGRFLPVEVCCQGKELVSVVLTQSPPEFGQSYEDFGVLAEALGLEKEDLSESLPAQVVSTGAGHLLVPVRSRTAIARARPDAQRLVKVLKAVDGEGCYLYCLEPVLPSSMAHARFFNPTVGIAEDSATGTAAGPLACQLVRHGIVKDGATIVIEQGYEMKRPSLLRVTVRGKVVQLAGRGVKVIEGMLRTE